MQVSGSTAMLHGSLTLISRKHDGEYAPLVRDSRSAVRRLPGVASPNNFDLYYHDHGYQPKDYIIKIAPSQHFLILST